MRTLLLTITLIIAVMSLSCGVSPLSDPQTLSIQKLCGDNQTVQVNSVMPDPLVVGVLDRNGKGAYHQWVEFIVIEGEAFPPNQYVMTDCNGRAGVKLVIGNGSTVVKVEVQISGTSTTTIFNTDCVNGDK